MHSLRTKIALLTVFVITVAVTVVTVLSVVFIRRNERVKSEQLLLLLCETGEQSLDYYLDNAQKSVARAAAFAEGDLDGLEPDKLAAHMERAEKYFEDAASKTNGVLTFYYRIDPEVSGSVKGFWYTDLDGEVFVPHEVTDITLYDTQDNTEPVWFTVPKNLGTPVWLPPYVTDNLDVRVISYNVPIRYKNRFIGVMGVELDYGAMVKLVESIRLYKNGYAFLNDAEGNIFYHPYIDVMTGVMPDIPAGLVSDNTYIAYRYNDIDKLAVWLPLINGMRINVAVPVAETEGNWHRLIREIVCVSVVVLVSAILFTMWYTGRITEPLKKLTEAAELANNGKYNFKLDYNRDDELGRLTRTFRTMADHMRDHIDDLSKQVYVDALTSVKNKGAFSIALENLQKQIGGDDPDTEFAVAIFDCDDLKSINDRYGHDKGDIYLKNACRIICRVFQHSPVYRIGGDEFSVIMNNNDYKNREELMRRFEKESEAANASAGNDWEKVRTSKGMAEYDPETDKQVYDTVRRADKIMYENKREQKKAEKK